MAAAEVDVEPVPAPKVFEIERKFVYTDSSEKVLTDIGAKLQSHVTFTDTYYDTEDYRLTTKNCWLRQRDGAWQLKCPLESMTLEGKTCQYTEYENEAEILKVVSGLLGQSCDNSMNISDLLKAAKCTDFATFKTNRKFYELTMGETFNVVLDEADYGFRVGEIELIVIDETKVPYALQQIDELATKLGFQSLSTADLPQIVTPEGYPLEV